MKVSLDFTKLPDFIEPEKTISEIGGYSHNENIISNYLQYFLMPDNDHSFNDLLYRSLHHMLFQEEEYQYPENISCYREVVTSEQNRIDLLIVTEDKVIAIENKIFHDLKNPFDNYEEYVNTVYPDKKRVGVLLSLRKGIIKNPFFKELTYEFLIKTVKEWHRKQFGVVTNLKDIFFLDLLKSIENLMNNKPIDSDVLEYLSNNKDGIIKLNKTLNYYHEKISQKIDILSNSLENYNFFEEKSLWKQNWIKEKLENLVHLKLGDKVKGLERVEIKLRISPDNWTFELWETDRIKKDLREFIETKSKQKFLRTDAKKSREFIIISTYSVDADISELSEKVNDFIVLINEY